MSASDLIRKAYGYGRRMVPNSVAAPWDLGLRRLAGAAWAAGLVAGAAWAAELVARGALWGYFGPMGPGPNGPRAHFH